MSSTILATFTTDRVSLVVAEVLTLLFFASAVLQLNDDDLHIWGSFYVCHMMLAGCIIFRRKCSVNANTLHIIAIGMTIWSLVMAVISSVRLMSEKYSSSEAKEELVGSVLGVTAAGYFTSLLNKGLEKKNADES